MLSKSRPTYIYRPLPGLTGKQPRVDVLAIGTSTGGPNALAELIPAIPGDFPVPIVIVQHMPPVFTRLLAARLNERSALTVQEGKAGEVLKAGDAWIAPGDHHMTVERHGLSVQLATNQEPPEKFLPASGRSFVSFRCKSLMLPFVDGCFYGHGLGRSYLLAAHPRKRRAGICSGRKQLGRLGHARTGDRRGTCGRHLPAWFDGHRDHSPGNDEEGFVDDVGPQMRPTDLGIKCTMVVALSET